MMKVETMTKPEVALLRDPIFNDGEALIGYEFKPQHVLNGKLVDLDTETIANFLHQVISTLSNKSLPAAAKTEIFLPISNRFIEEKLILMFSPDHLVFEIPFAEKMLPPLESALNELGKQYRFAVVNTPYVSKMSQCGVHYSVLDCDKFPSNVISAEVKRIKAASLIPIVRGVNTREQFREFAPLKVYFQGRCFSEPEKLAGTTLNPSFKHAARVLQMILEEDVGLRELEQEIKRDVALTYGLIKLVRSPLYGIHYANTIQEALMVLGFKELWRWMSIIAYTQVQPNAQYSVLANTASVRARFAELLIEVIAPQESKAEMFIVGMFSLLDTLLHIPMQEIVEQLKLSERMSHALTGGVGLYGKILQTVVAFETGAEHELLESCTALKITPAQASEYHVKALHWAAHNLLAMG